MYQGPTQAISALESGGNLEKAYQTLAFSQTALLREILIELRIMSQLLQEGLNTQDDPDELREDAHTDLSLSVLLDG